MSSGPLPVLSRGTVHVWTLWIGGHPDPSNAARVLSGDEKARAAAFVFDIHRNRYVAGRVVLRELLGGYLECEPAAVEFLYSPHGKPEVSAPLHFNLAHCDDVAVVGLTLDDRVGVDVERVRRVEDVHGVARSVFSDTELSIFHHVDADEVSRTFFNCWTRKEAFVKAVGEGLSYPLKDFDVTLAPGEPAQLLTLGGSEARAKSWSLFDLRPLDGWVGAVAIDNPDAGVELAGWLGEPPEGASC